MMHSRFVTRVIAGSLLAAGVTASLVACGGGSSDTLVTRAATDLAAPANASTTAALYDTPLSFANGVPELGTTGATTITFSANATTPAEPVFSIKTSDGGEAKGTTTFGSCIFTVTSSTTGFLQVGKVIRIDPCSINAKTKGAEIGKTSDSNVTLLLGKNNSVEVSVPLTLQPDGTVKFKNNTLGQVTVSTSLTGGGN